jgi:hypothetical protein
VILGTKRDVALPLALPKLTVVTDSINSKVANDADTLHSYNRVVIKGHIENNGMLEKSFNGIVMPTLYDKSKKITTLANDGGTPFEFNLQNKILYKGKASVKEGEFSVSFMYHAIWIIHTGKAASVIMPGVRQWMRVDITRD